MVPEYRRYSLFANAEFEISPAFKPFAQVSFGSTTGESVGAQGRYSMFTGGALTIRGDNPYLPFAIANAIGPTGSISLGKAFNDLGNAMGRSKTDTFRAVAGIKGALGGGWRWEIYYQHGRTDYNQQLANNIIPARLRQAIDAVALSDGRIVCRDQSNGCIAYNPLGNGNFSQGAVQYVTGTSVLDRRIRQNVISANLSGDLFRLPGGPLSVALGGEYRRDSLVSTADPISRANGFYTFNSANVAGAVKVTEGFGELNAPLLADLPFVKSLTLNGAVRRTHYSTSGAVTTWKFGGVWEPASFVRLRATRSRDIRAPNITELFSPLISGQTTVADPLQKRQVLVPFLTGGNAQLSPEMADTHTLGIVLNPVRNLFVSLDAFDIKVADVITQTGANNIVSLCTSGSATDCARITRDAASGNITLITDTQANLNRLSTRGIDVEINYRHPLAGGTLSFKGLATYVDRLRTDFRATGTSVDVAGQTGYSALGPGIGVPKVQATTYLTWTSASDTSITIQNRFISKGRYNVNQIGPDENGYNVNSANSSNDNSVASRVYTNLSVTQSFGGFGSSKNKNEIYFVVNNLFDKDPPIAPGVASATNGILFDQVGRTLMAGVRLRY